MEKQERISDEDFINRYTERKKHIVRSDKYVKNNEKKIKSGFGYWIFLGFVFVISYYVFSHYYFVS